MQLSIKIADQVNYSYRAWCPGLPGCVVYGRSKAEAKKKIMAAINGYLATVEVALPRELGRKLQKELTCPAA